MADTERINAICEVAGVAEIDDLSDGFHTFRQLYYQRMILFAAIVKQNKDRAWKSLRHEDGELCFGGGWFIVGIDTPEGSYTYHYENMYFDLFDCEILDYGKHWDGHTEKDVTRLLSLQDVTDINVGNIISRQAAIDAVDAIGHIATMPDGDKCVRRSAVKYTLSMLPPAQPEERTEKRTETYACDLISRQAAIDLLSDYANTVSLDEKLNVSARIAIQIGITNCIGIVNHNIPSVQPERKKGKWKFEKMKHIINGEVRDAIICSECDSGYFRYDISDNTVQNIPNFCPNCGADMRGGQDE